MYPSSLYRNIPSPSNLQQIQKQYVHLVMHLASKTPVNETPEASYLISIHI